MKKIIWIDIGTHFAQEHSSIFSSDFYFYSFIARRLISSRLFKRGKFVSNKELKEIITYRNKIRERSNDFYSIFIEANSKIARKKKFYPNANLFFNLALTDEEHKPTSIAKLYLGDSQEYSQGSSIFLEKHNVNQDSFVAAFGVSANDFFKELELYLSEKFNDYLVMLRLNCEGVEDSIIYSAHNSFGDKLELICGSLKDVAEVKGLAAFERLEHFIADNGIVFAQFYSAIYTWSEGQKAILKLLKKYIPIKTSN